MAYAVLASAFGTTKGTPPFNAATAPDSGSFDTTGATYLLVYCASFTGTIVAPTDNQGNTYSALTAQQQDSILGQDRQRWYGVNAPTTSTTHTVSAGWQNCSIAVLALSGNNASPFDQTNSNSAAAATVTTGSLTNADANGISVAAVTSASGGGGGGPWSIDTGFTIQTQIVMSYGVQGLAIATLNPSTSSAKNPTWTWDATMTQLAGQITLILPVAGGSPPQVWSMGLTGVQ